MKMEKVPWHVASDGVVVGVGLRCMGKGTWEMQKRCFSVGRAAQVHQGRNHIFKVGIQFLGLGHYYPSTEKIDRSTQFGAVGYIITLYSSKGYEKSWDPSKFWRCLDLPDLPSGCAHAYTSMQFSIQIRGRILLATERSFLHLFADALSSSNSVSCHIWGEADVWGQSRCLGAIGHDPT